jgi:hypothetical protein
MPKIRHDITHVSVFGARAKNAESVTAIRCPPQFIFYGDHGVGRFEREKLGNREAAHVLGISKAPESNRYIRAVMRLRKELATMPGFFESLIDILTARSIRLQQFSVSRAGSAAHVDQQLVSRSRTPRATGCRIPRTPPAR